MSLVPFAVRPLTRSGGLFALSLAAFILFAGSFSPARAQDEKAAAPAPEAEAAPAPPPQPEPEANTRPAATSSGPEEKGTLRFLIESSGFFGGLVILMSITMVALIIRMFMEYRMRDVVPPALVDRLEEAIKDRKFQEAYDACRDDPSVLARLVRTGVANLPLGRTEAKEAMNAAAEEIAIGMEGRNNYLGTIGTLGPLVGLLGTVQGMIGAFRQLATVKGAQADPTALAGNISLALVVTMEGLLVAVPAIFFFQFFRGRIITLMIEASKVADRTINEFMKAAKQPTGATAATPNKPNA
jgi:biopolymer transport protein ExbB